MQWNELHHLLIMEQLGGNALWSDRFFGYHAAIVYYWALVAVYLCSPRIAYQFMEVRMDEERSDELIRQRWRGKMHKRALLYKTHLLLDHHHNPHALS